MNQATYHRRVAEGVCPRCGATPEPDYVLCRNCLNVDSLRYRENISQQRVVALKLEALFGWMCAQGKLPIEDYAI